MHTSWTVCVSSTEGDFLSTAASLRSVLGATSTATDTHAYQLDLLRRATAWAEGYLGYPLTVQVYNEVVPAYGNQRLLLEHTPIRAILRFFDSTSTADATAIASSEYRIDDRGTGILSRTAGYVWTAGVQYGLDHYIVPNSEDRPWLIEYAAGWTQDGLSTDSENFSTQNGTTSTGRTLPYDVEQGILLKAREFWQSAPAGVQSEGAGDLRVTYMDKYNYRSEAEDLLRRYRRI